MLITTEHLTKKKHKLKYKCSGELLFICAKISDFNEKFLTIQYFNTFELFFRFIF